MTSQGSPYARFRRALLTQNVHLVDAAARELPVISLDDALRIVVVLAIKRDARYERAALRWAARLSREHGLSLKEMHRVLALLDVLPEAPEAVEVTLRRYCG